MVGIYCSSLPDGAPSSGSSSSAQAGEPASADWAGVLLRQVDASGVIPQVTAILTPGAAPPALLLADFTFTAATFGSGAGGGSRQQGSMLPVGTRRGALLAGGRGEPRERENRAVWPVVSRGASGFVRLLVGAATGLLWEQPGRLSGDTGRLNSTQGDFGLSAAGHSRGERCCCCGRAEHANTGVRCGSGREAINQLRELLGYLPASNLAPARQVRLKSEGKAFDRHCGLLC